MRMRHLVELTGVTRETIHYYTREGLLPPFKKTSRNQAEYDQRHVVRILLVKELQEKYFLPIAAIRRIIEHMDGSTVDESVLLLKSDYLKPMERLLPEELRGEEEFLRVTGIIAERLANFEDYGVIRPRIENGVKIYSHDDLKLGQLIGDMRRVGLSAERGFQRDGLRVLRDLVAPALDECNRQFRAATSDWTPEERDRLRVAYLELIPLFIYHMVHILLREKLDEPGN